MLLAMSNMVTCEHVTEVVVMGAGDETKIQSECVYKINVYAYEFQRHTF